MKNVKNREKRINYKNRQEDKKPLNTKGYKSYKRKCCSQPATNLSEYSW